MPSSFTDWSVQDIVGRLTKREVIACLPLGWIRARDVRTWGSLGEAILALSDRMKAEIYQAACAKEILVNEVQMTGRKRKRENREWVRRYRRRSMEGES